MAGSGSSWCFLDFLSYIPNCIGSYTHDLYEAEAYQMCVAPSFLISPSALAVKSAILPQPFSVMLPLLMTATAVRSGTKANGNARPASRVSLTR